MYKIYFKYVFENDKYNWISLKMVYLSPKVSKSMMAANVDQKSFTIWNKLFLILPQTW